MKKYLFGIVLILAFYVSNESFAQTIEIQESPTITRMMDRYIELNRMNSKIHGWRIQLLATTDRRKVEMEKNRFQALYPGIYVDWTHSNPYYKLRAGAFDNRLDVYRMLFIIKSDYPSAYPARELISPSAVLN